MKRHYAVVGIAILIVFALFATRAAANPVTAEVPSDYGAALAYWQTSSPPPQCASVSFEMQPTDPRNEGAIARTTQPSPGQSGLPCKMVIYEDAWARLSACERLIVVRHETGHLTGLGHSPDPENIMYAELEAPYWCADEPPAAAPPARKLAPEMLVRHRARATAMPQRWLSRNLTGTIYLAVEIGHRRVEGQLADNGCSEQFSDRNVVVILRLVHCGDEDPNPVEARYVTLGKPQNIRILVSRHSL